MSDYKNIVVLNDAEYWKIPYEREIKYKRNDDEEEEKKSLQEDIAANFNHIFKDMIYIPSMSIEPLKGDKRIPDFYAIDVKEKKLYVVEVELIEHGQDHIGSQIFGFNRILRASSSRTSLAQKINTYLKDTKQYELITNKDVLEILISICNNYEIVVIINEITNELKELINSQPLDKNKKIILLQFEKYKSVNSNVFIYKMDTLEKMANSGSAITENVHKHQTSFKRDDIRAVIPLGGHIYMPYKGKLFTATIESGGIRLEDGSIQRTPSAAAKQIRGTNTANGWVLWYQDIKCKRPIDLLRKSK